MKINNKQLQEVKKFIENHPEEARQFLTHDPKFIKFVLELMEGNDVPIVNFLPKGTPGENDVGETPEKRKTLILPGTPSGFCVSDAHGGDDNGGFSNYLLLAILAFVIQFVITMICIIFYK